MKRRSRTRRILKWVGLLGCVLTVSAYAFIRMRVVEYYRWAGADIHVIGTLPGRLRYTVFCSANNLPLSQVKNGLVVAPVPPEMRTPSDGLGWPYVRRTRIIPADMTLVAMPLWIVLLVLAIPTTFLWYRDRRPPKGHCQTCGYDLTGNVMGVCPECGEKA